MIRQSLTISYFTVLEAIRNKLFIFTVCFIVAMFGISGFVGDLAITQTSQLQSAMLGFVLRLLCIFLVSLFVITSTVREFDDKGFELLLSLSIPRWSYYFGKYIGFSLLSFIIAALIIQPLFIYSGYAEVLFWGISLFCELLIMVAASLFCLFTFGNITISFTIVSVFYLLARSISAIRLMSENPLVTGGALFKGFMEHLVEWIAVILPDFNIFTRSEWLIYGHVHAGTLMPVIGETVIYVFLLSCASLFDLYRKNL